MATYSQILAFYSREENESRKKYSVNLDRAEKKKIRRRERGYEGEPKKEDHQS